MEGTKGLKDKFTSVITRRLQVNDVKPEHKLA